MTDFSTPAELWNMDDGCIVILSVSQITLEPPKTIEPSSQCPPGSVELASSSNQQQLNPPCQAKRRTRKRRLYEEDASQEPNETIQKTIEKAKYSRRYRVAEQEKMHELEEGNKELRRKLKENSEKVYATNLRINSTISLLEGLKAGQICVLVSTTPLT